ncbi:hypothetical protein [Archangium sp.]|uniref:hypothetical protein n=1 Tax=Archangium sp. TaxID=1872627 RepID=UPI00286C69B9|nr:hypothetical protein [Archangium sp.]
MSDARVVARLEYDGADPTLVPVGPEGRAIVLDIPAGVELRGASLTLQAPGDDATLDVVPGATLATSTNKKQLVPTEELEWFSVDWGTRRPLASLKVKATTPLNKGRLSIAESGPWYQPGPFETIPLADVEQPLPGVTASRLMVEFLKSAPDPTKPKELVTAKVLGVVVKAAARPADLTALLEPGALFFHQAVPMQPLEKLTLGDNLRSALQRAWPAGLKGGRVTLTLRSSVPGKLRQLDLTLDTVTVMRAWSGGEESLSLPVATGGEVIGRVNVTPARKLREVRLRMSHRLRDERLPLEPQPPALPSMAHRCGAGFAAAQAFSPPTGGGLLAGIDLHLRPLTRTCKGTLTLFPEAYDRPGDKPLKGATLELVLEQTVDAPWPARWVSFDAPKPLHLEEAKWWAVLTLTEGDVLWTLDKPGAAPRSGELAPLTALYRTEDTGPWLPREEPAPVGGKPGALWAITRPRLRAPAAEPPPPPSVKLRWGAKVLTVLPDDTGLVSLDERALEGLTPPAGDPIPPLEVVVQSRVSGEVTLSELRVTSPRSESFKLFTPK